MPLQSVYPQQAAAQFFELGNTLSSKQEFERAAAAYTSAIECGAEDPRCYFNLGVVRTIQKRVQEAERCYGAALRLRPDYPEAHNNLGILRQFAGDHSEARRHYVKSFESPHGFPEARYNYASLLQQCGFLAEACEEYRAFLKQKPRHASAHNNFGNTLLGLGRPVEALTHFQQALALDPTAPEVPFNRGVAHLTLGHFKEGWRDYESRFHQPGRPGRRTPGKEWRSQPVKGKRVLIYAEQGLGDTLQFIRFAQQIRQRGAQVIVECQAPLVKLLSRIPAIEAVAKNSQTPPVDLQLALLSAPQRLGTNLANLPSTPYLTAEPSLQEEWRGHLARIAGAASPRVGLCWTGNPRHMNDRNRSMASSHFNSLREIPGLASFNLCPDAPGWPDLNLRPLLRPLVDFEETAALIANLDVVITVDTAVAHLAGAMGKPVWILLPYASDWRWLTGRNDSPWYPSAKLFRQRAPGDWHEVMDRVRQQLSSQGLSPAMVN